MARQVFYSFHYDDDASRVQQVKQMGRVESQSLLAGNKWEEVKKKGDAAIQKWIDDQMQGRTCLVVLVGAQTASRRWVKYEIKKAWKDGLGVVGIRIHGLKDFQTQKTTSPGANPFEGMTVSGTPFSSIATLYNPHGADSKAVYASIADNIEGLVEKAIKVRGRY